MAGFYELALFFFCLGATFAAAAFSWLLYVAVEPYVRRRWPATLVSWSRLLAGRFRDPVVGRDLLLGCVLAVIQIVVVRAGWYASSWLESAPLQPYFGPTVQFLGVRGVLPAMAGGLPGAIVVSLATLLLLFLFRVLLRREWAAGILFVIVFTVFGVGTSPGTGWPFIAQQIIVNGLTVFLLIRYGLLPIVASAVFSAMLGNLPLTTDTSAWYAGLSLFGLLVAAAVAGFAFYTSLGGRPAFGASALDEDA